MSTFLDRGYQRELLLEMAENYPENHHVRNDGGDRYAKNVYYLHEHGLAEAKFYTELGTGKVQISRCKITARGLDFLQDDGGLSSILNVVTVKLHDDTIRQLLIDRVEASSEDPTVKGRLIEAIKTAPAETLKSVTQKALEAGVQSLPNAVQLLQGWLSA
ncbi:hypothetical protein [Leisingera methylohalidivorans]|uniref:Uncharacterized protein n=1 Tax=Leisingera methylohalidivorans DSM 14336 TaxID=999552 RepID=V9VR17_9RHOB|nr:hypothetical protein [Leisingera methylohalidivorans]AHD00473.1 hypothetical protein METH_06895 [Leisingera methylohalidivorans DSM 14336]